MNKHIEQIINEHNKRVITDFEGYSPDEMHQILHFTFSKESPLSLRKLLPSDYQEIPVLNLAKYLMEEIKRTGAIKLTSKGFLPTMLVADLYNQGFKKDKNIESGLYKLYKESDSTVVNLPRNLIELAGLTKKRLGKLTLTRKGEDMLNDNTQLLETIFKIFATKFNWAYYDGYDEEPIGQFGYGFSLILLSKYGNEKKQPEFYAQKYFDAYPQFLDTIRPTYGSLQRYAAGCYSLRTFELFLDYLGLIEIDGDGKIIDSVKFIKKSALFDKLIEVRPPAKS